METDKLHNKFESCFRDWIIQQHQDLEELLQALTSNPDTENLQLLAEKGLKHFEEYQDNRALLAQYDAPALLCPVWCTSFENAFLWIGGCRPSVSIRLIYSLCGSEINDAQVSTLFQVERKGNLAEISSDQLNLINSVHCKIIKEEERLSERMASLQEEIADDPLVMIAKKASEVGESSCLDLDEALKGPSLSLERLLVDADKLRLSTLKELMNILTPLQTADLLVATKKLHLSMHEWGKRRDEQLGRK
ncbi:hypothetical protein ACH5RR_028177 [Cinchona calisaya]|uniref:DOG1 domain-containing protein n=1 Tax=Cinchona calisaya TaxID=153742 RepID=A0ABD2YMZ8_9GENT